MNDTKAMKQSDFSVSIEAKETGLFSDF